MFKFKLNKTLSKLKYILLNYKVNLIEIKVINISSFFLNAESHLP